MTTALRNSTEDQSLLRPIALWAADFAERALPVFEDHYPDNPHPREAVIAAREFGTGKKRDNSLRTASMAAFKAGKATDDPVKYVTRSACATAAVAYTHTDLLTGVQGIRQARHILGPVVYAALALESESDGIITRRPHARLPKCGLFCRRCRPSRKVKNARTSFLSGSTENFASRQNNLSFREVPYKEK